MEKKLNPLDTIIDFKGFFYKILNNWFYFLLSIILALTVAFSYTRYSKKMYESSTKILINNEEESFVEYKSLYPDLFDQNNASMKDQIQILSSFDICSLDSIKSLNIFNFLM